MRSDSTIPRRAPGRSPLGDERGMLLVITMIILLVVSTLAATSLINAFLERSLAKNQNYASIALNAADGGLGAAMAWLNDPANAGALPGSTGNRPIPATDPWLQDYLDSPAAGSLDRNAGSAQGPLASGGTFEVTFSLLTDAEDKDMDGDTSEVVVFNRSAPTPPVAAGNHGRFDYGGSFFLNPGEGFPVIKINSKGRYGLGGYRELEMEVARNKFNIRANGAVTAMGNVNTIGNMTVDGRSHDSNGNLGGSCTDAFAGINVPAPIDLNGDGDYSDPGESSYAVASAGASAGNMSGVPAGTGSDSIVSFSPDQALGLCDANGDGDCDDGGEIANVGGPIDVMIAGLPTAGTVKDNGNIRYANLTGNYDIATSATGVLIVHNPLFDPRVWRCSIPVVPDPANATNPNLQLPNPDLVAPPAGRSNICFTWNAATGVHDRPHYNAALNADYQVNNFAHQQTGAYAGPRRPRNMTGNSTVTFKGAIVADQIQPINGNITVIGAIISLSGVSMDVLGTGFAKVLYSCDALNLFTAQGYVTRLGWHRLYD